MPVGDRIKELRIRKNQSLQKVADDIGASKAHIWELESNRSKNPSLDLLQKLANHFGTTVSYLIEEGNNKESQAQLFFRRNSNKLGALEKTDFEALEQLVDVMSSKKMSNKKNE